MDYLQLIDPVKQIAAKAGELILNIYNSNFKSSIKTKIDNSPVTIADKKANDYITKQLKLLTPDIPIISEEDKQIPFSKRKRFNYYWLVDPLDGTKEFIKKNDEFTVNIALIKSNQPILGVIYLPVKDFIYWGIKHNGSYSIKNNHCSKLNANIFDTKDIGLKILLSRSHLDDSTIKYLDNFNKPIIHNIGSSLKFLYIAEGTADIYYRFTPTMEWDIAAAKIILEEAGGNIKNIISGKQLLFNKTSLINPGFIATGKTKSLKES
jgi:3'(2'), 5'-bisphosphate nucleotidase